MSRRSANSLASLSNNGEKSARMRATSACASLAWLPLHFRGVCRCVSGQQVRLGLADNLLVALLRGLQIGRRYAAPRRCAPAVSRQSRPAPLRTSASRAMKLNHFGSILASGESETAFSTSGRFQVKTLRSRPPSDFRALGSAVPLLLFNRVYDVQHCLSFLK